MNLTANDCRNILGCLDIAVKHTGLQNALILGELGARIEKHLQELEKPQPAEQPAS